MDCETVRKYLNQVLEAPIYGTRTPQPRLLEPYEVYLRERILAFPGLSGKWLPQEIQELGYPGDYSAVTDYLRDCRPAKPKGFVCGRARPLTIPSPGAR